MTNASKLALAAAALALCVLALRVAWPSSERGSVELALAPSDELGSLATDAATPSPLAAHVASQGAQPEPALEATRAPAGEHFVIQGVVRDEHGTPVAGAKVLAEGAQGKVFGAISGKLGEFGFRALAPGRWTIRASAIEHVATTRPLLLDGAQRVEQLELVLAREPRLVVYVRTPAGDAHPETIDRDPSRLLAIATLERPPASLTKESRARSTLGIWKGGLGPGGRLGEFDILASSDYYVSLVFGAAVLATEQVRNGAPSVNFVLDAGRVDEVSASVTARFLELDVAPLTRVMAWLEGANGARAGQWVEGEGRVEFLGLGPDEYTLKLEGGRLRREFRLEPGDELDLGDLVASAGARVRVHIEAPGPTRKDLHVSWGRAELDPSEYGLVKEGSAEIRGLEPGRIVIGLSEKGRPPDQHARIAAVEVSADAIAEVTLRLEPVGWLVLKPDGAATLGTRYRVRDELSGLVNRHGEINALPPLRLPLPQGAWLLELDTPAGARIDKPLFVGAEPVVVTLPR